MLDGFVAAIGAGPATYEPLRWLCPLLGVTGDAINDGGTFDNRVRFTLEVVREIRRAWPDARPLAIRVSAFLDPETFRPSPAL